MHNYVRVILSALSGLLICNHSIADAILSLKSINDYVYVNNIRYPIEGRGIGTSGGYNIIRGEDVAFLNEGYEEMALFSVANIYGSDISQVNEEVGGVIADIDSLSDLLYSFSTANIIVNDTKYYLHDRTRWFGIFEGGIPSASEGILSTTADYFPTDDQLEYIYSNSNYTNGWNISAEFNSMFRRYLSQSGYQYNYIMKKSNIQNTYRILKTLQNLYVHQNRDQDFCVLNSSSGYANGSIRNQGTISGNSYTKTRTYVYKYIDNDIVWTYNDKTTYSDPSSTSSLLSYSYSERKTPAYHIWAKHTSDREDEDEYGNVTTTKLYTANLSYGGLNTTEYQSERINKMSPNNLLIEFSERDWFTKNGTPFTSISSPVSDVKVIVSFVANANYYYTELSNTGISNTTSTVSKSISKSFLAFEQISDPIFKVTKRGSSYDYNSIYIVVPDDIYLSAVERLKNYAKKDMYKSPDDPPRPSISLKSSNVEASEVDSSYEWLQGALETRNNINITIGSISIAAYSFKPKCRVTFEE